MGERPIIQSVFIGILLFIGCTIDLQNAGTVTDTGNATVISSFINNDGTIAVNTIVMLTPAAFNVETDSAGSVQTRITDAQGTCMFTRVAKGTYSLEAVHGQIGTRTMISNFQVIADSGIFITPTDTLRIPGSIKVEIPDDADRTTGYVFIPGTHYAQPWPATGDYAVIDSVPAVTLPSIWYGDKIGLLPKVIRYAVKIVSNKQTVIAMPAWRYARTLVLNTAVSGADVAADVYNFPVLIRLTGSTFIFSQAHNGGADIRFMKSDTTPLAHEIEQWDSSGSKAVVWVRVDTMYGNNATQSITMLWGNSSAVSESNSAAVFDTINGFQGVWHLGQAGGTTAIDATANKYDGTPYNMSSSSLVPGQIGDCQKFSGDSSYFTMNGTASSKLNFEKDGIYSVSAWVYADTFDLKKHAIITKGDNQYSLEHLDSKEWEFAEYKDLTGWEATRSNADMKTWTHVAGVRVGAKQYLFINGICTDSSFEMYPDTDPRNTGFDVMIGRTKTLTNDYTLFFKGKIDEVRITNTTPGNDWFRLCYMNQKEQDALVKFNME